MFGSIMPRGRRHEPFSASQDADVPEVKGQATPYACDPGAPPIRHRLHAPYSPNRILDRLACHWSRCVFVWKGHDCSPREATSLCLWSRKAWARATPRDVCRCPRARHSWPGHRLAGLRVREAVDGLHVHDHLGVEQSLPDEGRRVGEAAPPMRRLIEMLWKWLAIWKRRGGHVVLVR